MAEILRFHPWKTYTSQSYHWTLNVSQNGQVICTSENYLRKAEAKHSMDLVHAHGSDAKVRRPHRRSLTESLRRPREDGSGAVRSEDTRAIISCRPGTHVGSGMLAEAGTLRVQRPCWQSTSGLGAGLYRFRNSMSSSRSSRLPPATMRPMRTSRSPLPPLVTFLLLVM
ncbi:YegP family protein [Clavibacter michiganensis]|uniref:DUF1508 domain-containing protein n=1 Tax=Clavibacter michiganensis subsp. michiganensis (strain NCPPB 382) TaxID=443906 RepID=A5CLQ6_CLAM3|nr:YegP family protein [Clavibacter michiganensis subsp. michiganensis]MWJ23541.1 DUF1508 domain-containing protein [Clavibacter michiganensis subsp. michiganensis]QIT16204.1 DUF1508 domain-containing protein [Clavibacter michiganensis subsp. michiganensis]UQZ80839.1 YegP family protein [Clavibacter michiganensis subsp. michiganensis]CAM98527.1 hypothetical protein pCM2_0043 [Clavibacter michiganensis subsp. michiganensis NCPPB 382]